MRKVTLLVVLTFLVAGCAAGASPATGGTGPVALASVATTTAPTPTATVAQTPTTEPTATAEPTLAPTPAPTPKPAPVSYATLSSRNWAKLVKAPDNYIGKTYQVWACISQFDTATGPDAFRGEGSYKKQAYWYSDADNSWFTGDQAALSDFVADDVVVMHVVVAGSYSYDTQAGGNTTVPSFEVVRITRKGSCK